MPALSFLLYSRPDCGLCEDMLQALLTLPEVQGIKVEIMDVDAKPTTRERYGHKIPVLLYGGELVCHGRLDVEEVHKALALHA